MELPFVEPAPLALPAEPFGLVVAQPALVEPGAGVAVATSELVNGSIVSAAVAPFQSLLIRSFGRYRGLVSAHSSVLVFGLRLFFCPLFWCLWSAERIQNHLYEPQKNACVRGGVFG